MAASHRRNVSLYAQNSHTKVLDGSVRDAFTTLSFPYAMANNYRNFLMIYLFKFLGLKKCILL